MTTDRRSLLTLLAALAASGSAHAQAPRHDPHHRLCLFTFAGLEGEDIKLADHAGKPILIVNTASLCGYTPQYAGLQQLWSRYRERGLMIVGVPSNDFGGQEPGGADEIYETAARRIRRQLPDGGQGRRHAARTRTRSTNGRRPSGRSKRRAGISTNT